MLLQCVEAQVHACFSLFEDRLSFTQDRCMVCTKRTIGLETFWMHPMELLGDMGHVESHIFPFGDSVSVGAR